jgi:galactitol-specific phosphotransferase system IIB component
MLTREAGMKRVIFIAGCCLALTSCGRGNGTSMTLPSGFHDQKFESFYSMRDCIRHAKAEVRSKNIQNVNENGSEDDVFVVSGTLDNFDSILYECFANPYPNATLTIAIKPATASKQKTQG